MTPRIKNATEDELEELGVSLIKYVDTRFSAQEAINKISKEAIEGRLGATEKVVDARFENTNEWRGTVSDLIGQIKDMIGELKETFLPRSEYNVRHEKISDDIQELKEFRVKIDSKADQKTLLLNFGLTTISMIIGIAGLVMAYLER